MCVCVCVGGGGTLLNKFNNFFIIRHIRITETNEISDLANF